MSEIKVNSIKGVGASTAAITVDNTAGTCTANITNNLSNRNLIINGAMQVAQRGTSSTTSGYGTVDRFKVTYSGTDEAPTQAQVDVSVGSTAGNLGFRKALKVTNGNQTSGAGSSDFIRISTFLEGQDIANSGWNYTSSSSFLTLSFHVKSSVAQNFYGFIRNTDGTMYQFPFETGSLSANTWTKVTVKIAGNSNLTFNNDTDGAFELWIHQFSGTDETASSVALNTWATYSGTAKMPDFTSTWYTTDDATFEITGVQLEVSDHATDFEHRSFGQELALCQRYYYQVTKQGSTSDVTNAPVVSAFYETSSNVIAIMHFPVQMRTNPSLVSTDTSNGFYIRRTGAADFFDNFTLGYSTKNCARIFNNTDVSGTAGVAGEIRQETGDSSLAFNAEL